MRAVLSSVLTDAVAEGILLANPALSLFRKGKRAPYTVQAAEHRERIRPLSEAHLERFFAAAPHEPMYYVYFVALGLAGLRPSEGRGLRWPDLDLVGLTIQVERALRKDGTAKLPKDGERRVVEMHPMLAVALRRLAVDQKARALEAGRPWDPDGYVFVTPVGTPLDLSNLEKSFKRTLKRAELPPFHVVYDLRHSYATAFLAKGVPITWVAAQLGHAKPTTTLRYYAHWLPNVGQRYVGRLLAAGPGQEPERDVTSMSHVTGDSR